MNRPLLKEALIPTLLLGGLWLAFSLATTVYIAWLDHGYQRVLEENVTSIRLSGEVQGILWSMHDAVAQLKVSGSPSDASRQIASKMYQLHSTLDAAESSAKTDRERWEVAKLKRLRDEYQQHLNSLDQQTGANSESLKRFREKSLELAVQMSARCDKLRELNEDLITVDSSQRRAWNRYIGGARIFLAFVGPILGVWLGFRAAFRARKRLAEISVRLEGATGELGRLHLSPSTKGTDLNDLDQQVVAITARMDSVLQQLQSARHEVLRSERLAAVGQLAAGVAHELRNPLTSVNLLVQIVAREQPEGSDTAKQLGVVLDEIARMERTIQSLLDFARPPAQKRLRHDLRETLGRAMNLVEGRAARDRVEIESNLPLETCEIDGDPEQLRQVFVNLLLNSIDAMPNGGRVYVNLRCEYEAPDSDFYAAPSCVVEVSDDGSGIPENVIQHLFEPFVTTKERGTGLGLAVSRRIIEEHGGTLTAVNGPGGGAVFSVRLTSVAQLAPSEVATTVA